MLLGAAACGTGLKPVTRAIVVTCDTTRADRLGCYGYADAVTPTLDALAAEGVLFEQAVSPAPTTLASHSTMFTGLYPQDHGVRYNIYYKLNPAAETLAEGMRAAGFATAAFPSVHVVASQFGLDQGFDTWIEPPKRGASPETGLMTGVRLAGEGVDLVLDWIDEHPGEKLFVWLHFYDPHWPYNPPFPFNDQFRDRDYDGEIAYADAELGRLIEALRADPAWERTLVVVAGDHGEGLYDHGERWHSLLVYEQTQRVPLIIRAPGGSSHRIRDPVTLADIMPTVLDLSGVDPPGELRGRSLRDALRGHEPPPRDVYFETIAGGIAYGWAELFGIRDGRWKLIDSSDPELFNLEQDPGETRNLAQSEPQRLERMQGWLDELGRPIGGDGAALDASITLDAETEEMLAGLGYVAGNPSGPSDEDAPHARHLIDLHGEMLGAQGAMSRREVVKVEDISRYVLSRDPRNKWALHALAQALLQQDRAAEALPVAQRLVEVNAVAERHHITLAQAYKGVGQFSEARRAILSGMEQIPDSELLMYFSVVTGFEAGLPEICSAIVPEALASYPESGRMRVMEARCQARDGEAALALATLTQAVQLGFHGLVLLPTSGDFAKVAASDGFRALVESVKKSQGEDHQTAGETADPT